MENLLMRLSRKRYFLMMVVVLFYSISLKGQSHSDSTRTDHLVIKADILWPVAHLLSPENSTLLYTFSLEYRINKRFGVQLNGSFYRNPESDNRSGGYFIYPEGRLFLKNHFVGLYLKAGNYRDELFAYSTPDGTKYPDNLYLAIGVLYGYQLALGRFQLEGRIGFGITKEFEQFGATGNGAIDFSAEDPYWDAILGLNVGYLIF